MRKTLEIFRDCREDTPRPLLRPSSYLPSLSCRNGVILISTYLAIAVFLILEGASLSRTLENQKLSLREVQTTQALHYAEAGLDRAVGELRLHANYPGTNGATIPLGIGAYTISVAPYPNEPDLRHVTIEGLTPDPNVNPASISQDLAAIVRVERQRFSWGIFGDRHVESVGTVEIDGYDSQLGRYGPENLDTGGGHLATNNTDPNSIRINGNLAMGTGNLYCGVGCDPATAIDIHGRAEYGEALALDKPKLMPPITVPELPPGKEEKPQTFSGGTTTLDRNYPDAFPLDDGTYAIVASSLSITGNAAVLVGEDPMEIYVTGGTTMDGTVTVGDASHHNATKLLIKVTSSETVWIGGGATLYGALYVPEAAVDIGGDAAFFGAVVAKEIRNNGTVVVHFDQALEWMPGMSVSEVSLVTWTR